jgi:hypothetical protein
MNKSRKHHYLPRKYLKGFVNEFGSFFIYDKKTGKVFRNSPDNSFYESDLNTVTFPDGHSDDFIEAMYSKMESESWECFDRIAISSYKTQIAPLDKVSLFYFLLYLHWRLPSNLHFVDALCEKAFESGETLDFLQLKYKKEGQASDEIKQRVRGDHSFKKVLRLAVPFVPFHKDPLWAEKLSQWRFLYTQDERRFYVVGDNPIITEGLHDGDPVRCLDEFIFPVSGNILLVNTDKPLTNGLPPEFIMLYSMAIFERSSRFVACPDEDFLRTLVDQYSIYEKFGKKGTIIPEIFAYLQV